MSFGQQQRPPAAPAPAPGSPLFAAGLASFFDLEGVRGSFLVTGSGAVAARALPEIVDDPTLAEVSGRALRFGETLRTIGLDPDLCILRYFDHKLYLKVLPAGLLCILTGVEVNLPALRMAANLVARKVAPELARLTAADQAIAAPARASSPGFPAAPAPVVEDAPAGAAANSAPGVRMYRGRRIDD